MHGGSSSSSRTPVAPRRRSAVVCWARRSRCGGGRPSPSSRSTSGRRARRDASRSCDSAPRRSGSAWTSSSVGRATSCRSSRRSFGSTRCASARRTPDAALYGAGRQAESLDAFAAIRAALDELGLEPGQRLRQLQAKILRHGMTAPSDDVHDADADIVKAIARGSRRAGARVRRRPRSSPPSWRRRSRIPTGRPLDLARVSQYVATMNGSGPLYDELHRRFEAATEPQPVHHFLAALPPLLRARGAPHQLDRLRPLRPGAGARLRGRGRGVRRRHVRRDRAVSRASSGIARRVRSRGRSTSRTRTRRSSRSNVARSCSSCTAPSTRSPSGSGRAS